MEEGAKRRLVGAAVILALLVIFLPMLVEEADEPAVPDAALAVPPRPSPEPRAQPGPSAGLKEEEARIEPPTGAAELAPPPLYVPPVRDEPALVEDEPSTPVPIVEPGSGPQPRVTDREPAPPPKAAPPKPAPTPAAKPGGPSAWVVQVAALTEQPRAQALERDLRNKGLPAFIETVVIDGRTFHRVRVGPESDRKRIEALAASLKEQGLQPQILRHP